MIPVRLIATGKAVPVHSVTSDSLDLKLGHPAGYTLRKSGVLSRFVAAPDESQSQLGAAALLDALKNASLRPADIDLLICACGVPEQALPNTACFVAEHAGLPPGTQSFDVNASCLSFMAAFRVAASLPTALHEAVMTGRAVAGQRLLMMGTAAGLTIGGMILDL